MSAYVSKCIVNDLELVRISACIKISIYQFTLSEYYVHMNFVDMKSTRPFLINVHYKK